MHPAAAGKDGRWTRTGFDECDLVVRPAAEDVLRPVEPRLGEPRRVVARACARVDDVRALVSEDIRIVPDRAPEVGDVRGGPAVEVRVVAQGEAVRGVDAPPERVRGRVVDVPWREERDRFAVRASSVRRGASNPLSQTSPTSDSGMSLTTSEEDEPGLYRKGVGGARVEDLVLVTADGCEVLTHYPYDFVLA